MPAGNPLTGRGVGWIGAAGSGTIGVETTGVDGIAPPGIADGITGAPDCGPLLHGIFGMVPPDFIAGIDVGAAAPAETGFLSGWGTRSSGAAEFDADAMGLADFVDFVGGIGFSDGPAGFGSSAAISGIGRLAEVNFVGGKRFLPADSSRVMLDDLPSVGPFPDASSCGRNAAGSLRSPPIALDDLACGPSASFSRFFNSSSYRLFAGGSQRQFFAAASSSSIRCQSAAREPGRIPRILAICAAAAAEITCG